MDKKLYLKVSAWSSAYDTKIAFECTELVEAVEIMEQLKENDIFEVVEIGIMNGRCPLKDYLAAIIKKEKVKDEYTEVI